jgi:gamma-glutamyltranspeptidase / glutathione hydrolase
MDILSNSQYISRRSPVISKRGAVASSQPMATQAGIDILRKGGNAADAAVAVAAALQVTQPCSTGLGGDCFFLFYDRKTNKISALNGSGRSSYSLTLSDLKKKGFREKIPPLDPCTVTVPGAAAAWCDISKEFGQMPLKTVLQPAIFLAEKGFPVAPMTSQWWQAGAKRQLSKYPYGKELMIEGRGPNAGEVIQLPALAETLRILGDEGKESFYGGRIGKKIVDAVKDAGGSLTIDDLSRHESEWVEPISVNYRGFNVWECPPNGQGLAVLIALNILSGYKLGNEIDTAERYHLLIEAMRLAFADALWFVSDPAKEEIPIKELLSKEYAAKIRKTINPKKRGEKYIKGNFLRYRSGTDTVYFSVVDEKGNGCSFINSNYMGFGTGIVPRGCGFSLQNRGAGFVLRDDHPNCYAPGKRPYHTIIPGMITEAVSGKLKAVFGVMGGMMQPQGHLQVVSGLLDMNLDPQNVLDRRRFQIEGGNPGGKILLEAGLDESIEKMLKRYGHEISIIDGKARSSFGLGQIILIDQNDMRWCGSDPRGDGCALGH